MVLARKTTQCTNENTAWLALEAARGLANLSGVVPLLSGGVYLTRAVQACLQFTGSKDFSLAGKDVFFILQKSSLAFFCLTFVKINSSRCQFFF